MLVGFFPCRLRPDALGLGREELRALPAVAGDLPIRVGNEFDLAALQMGAGLQFRRQRGDEGLQLGRVLVGRGQRGEGVGLNRRHVVGSPCVVHIMLKN